MNNKNKTEAVCSFCGKNKNKVDKLIECPSTTGLYICNECVDHCKRLIKSDLSSVVIPFLQKI
ncbi:MAG TPA: ClpX C4-type zinc finger protein [Candidatus Moranbacteria bacterium]|nr:ClpX C4-type zinc finger protein [Candidatus Moranbacteria bacterium]